MIGQTVGHYRVVEKLGAGGMGEVYKAQDTKLGRLVALKFLPKGFSTDRLALARFQREAKTASTLNHPHILTVYEIGEEAGTLFIVTELVDGLSLRQLLREPISTEKAMNFARQILEGLSAAHHAGIVHRDLKPENIMVRSDGYLKLLDFGLAKEMPPKTDRDENRTEKTALTQPGLMVGTVRYMSPEQILGDSLDQRSDLFSFGVILYEMLCGKYPWRGSSTVEFLHAILHDTPQPISGETAKAHSELCIVLEKALEKKPSGRYQSADEFLAALTGRAEPIGASVDVSASSLAVLPFLFFGEIPERESLSLGFADALITTLGNLEDLVVPPTSAILNYAGGSDPLAACRALRVRHVLQGNIQRLGTHWRVSVQLYDAEARKITLAEKYDFTLLDIFEIQDEIGKRVAETLSRRFRRGSVKARDRYTTDPGAYAEFLEGLRESYSENLESLNKAIAALERAVKAAPEFALAHATLSYVCTGKYFGFEPRREWIEKAELHCQRAIELDPDLPEGHPAKAYILWSQARNFRHVEAIEEIQKGLALQPNLDHAHNRLGTICAHIGRFKEAQRAFEKAREVNPQNFLNHNIAQSYLWSGDLRRAEKELEVWERESPTNKYLLWFRPQPALYRGDLKTAKEHIDRGTELLPDEPLMISLQAMLHALHGEGAAALEYLHRACESPRSFGHTHHTHYQIACTYALLGERARALEWLEKTVDGGFACWPLFRSDPTLESLRTSEGFVSLVTRLEREFGDFKMDPL